MGRQCPPLNPFRHLPFSSEVGSQSAARNVWLLARPARSRSLAKERFAGGGIGRAARLVIASVKAVAKRGRASF